MNGDAELAVVGIGCNRMDVHDLNDRQKCQQDNAQNCRKTHRVAVVASELGPVSGQQMLLAK
jgi:hypothetical protein